jgi:ADP-heptose:LPS heptosyltransferase
VRFQVPEHAEDRTVAERIIREFGLEGGFAIINPGAGWPSKLWPTERYAVVARHLGEVRQVRSLVVWAGPAEQAMAEEVARLAGESARVAPATSLVELAALARRARLFIGADTGPMHLAAAVDTPCVGLYGPWPAARHGPYGSQHIALQKMLFEGPTRARRTAPAIYMESITTEMVCEACDRILMQSEECKVKNAK